MEKKHGIQDLMDFLDSDSISQELDKEFYTLEEVDSALKKLFFYRAEKQNGRHIKVLVGDWDAEVLGWLAKRFNQENKTDLNMAQYISNVVIKSHIRKAGKDYGYS